MPQNWLTNEAISNYIVFAAGILAALIAFLIRALLLKKRPPVVFIEKEKETSLLDIAPDARNYLKVTYNNRPISEFYQSTYFISNTGEVPLQDINLKFVVDGLTTEDAFALVLDTPTVTAERQIEVDARSETIELKIPFLNSRKDHGDYVRAQLFASKPTKGTKIIGGGLGWSVRYHDRAARNARIAMIVEDSASVSEIALRLLGNRLLP